MKKAIKKITVFAVLCILGLSSNARAEVSGDWVYERDFSAWYRSNNTSISTNGALILRYQGTNKEVTTPETLGGQTVVAIGNPYFSWGNSNSVFSGEITKVSLSTNIVVIQSAAFKGCRLLTNMIIPQRVSSIYNQAFYMCSGLKSINLSRVEQIYYQAFSGCTNLSEINLSSIINLWQDAFSGCTGLKSVLMGSGYQENGNRAFSGCTNLSNLIFSEGTQSVRGWNNLPNLSNVQIPSSLREIGNYAFAYSGLRNITIPSLSVTTIGQYAFKGCSNLSYVNILLPSSITTVEYEAFAESGLRSIATPPSVKFIAQSAFRDCSNLSSATISPGLTAIEPSTFQGSGLSSLSLPSGINRIGDHAFSDCKKLGTIITPNSVTNLGYSTFQGCTNLTNIILSSGLHKIGNNTFDNCIKLKTVVLPNRVSSVGNEAFLNCGSLTNVVLSDNTFSLGARAFANCTNLPSVSIPDSVAVLEDQVFQNCSRLTSVFLPDSVTRIGNLVFEGCSRLSSINVDPENLMFSSENGVLYNQIQVSLLQYPQARQGSSFSVPDGVLRINREAFLNCTNLLNIDLPRSVAFIGFDAFRGCSNLDNLYFLGNIPTLESGDPFSGVPEFTLYYLKRMTGWGATFVGRPTALLRSPVITSASNATARRGSSFTYQITASNNPTRFTATPLPAGLSLNTNTGLISGTPTVITNVVVTLGAINLAGTNNRTLGLNVLTNLATPPALGLPVLPVISSGTQIGGEIGAVFRYQAQASGIVTRFCLGGALPQGLTFQETNGLVGGMPLQSGNFPIPLWAMSGSNAGASVYLTISVPPLAGLYTNRAFASSLTSNQPAWFAFDGNTNTAWNSLSSGFPHRIVYDLGSNTLVSSVLLHQGAPGLSNSYAKAVQVFASSNQINWLSLGTFQGLTNGRNALSLTNPVTQRFVALRATSGVSTTWAVREVSMGVFRPVLSNGIATKIGPSLRLTGAVQPNGLLTTARFEYGTNSNSLNGFAQVNLPDRNGTSLVGVTNLITNGLVPGKTYFYRLTASNADGTTVTPLGSVGF